MDKTVSDIVGLLGLLKLLSKRTKDLSSFISPCMSLMNVPSIMRNDDGEEFLLDSFESWDDVCVFLYENCKNITTVCKGLEDNFNFTLFKLETGGKNINYNMPEILRVPYEIKKIVDSIDDTMFEHIETALHKRLYYSIFENTKTTMKFRRTWMDCFFWCLF
ncbi:uncharacterized protein EV154DRAFT_530202, partial [Mucor mucedo]|uniref:uncharacterized protein n=1 Tax=Mucor mucedo TaxID=29922 RepID=UPI00221FBB1B